MTTTETTYTAADVTADTSNLVAVLGGQFLATGVMPIETFERTFVGTTGGFETLDAARQDEFVAFGPFSDWVLDELLSSGELVEQELRLLGIAA